MGYISNYEYYLNGGVAPEDKNHGSYQYVSLPDIVTNYMMFYTGDDQIVDNVKKYTVRFHAKQIVKKLNYDAFKTNRVLEDTIGSDLKLVMPHDYVDYIRISLERNGVLYPLTENQKPFSAEAYLKDNQGELLFDGNGEVLYGTSELDIERLADTETISGTGNNICTSYAVGARFGLDTSKANGNPLFVVNQNAGVIDFDSRMRDELVVLEYISDGMKNGVDANIAVNKFFEDYMYLALSARILKSKRGISAVAKKEAKREASAELRNAKIRASDMHPSRLLMTLRGQDKWIK